MSLLAISAHDIDAAGLGVDQALPTVWLDAELAEASATARGPGHVQARLSRTGKEIVVRGKVTAQLTLPCARCLDPALVDVDGEIGLLLAPADAPKAGGKPAREPEDDEHELSAEDVERDTYDGETVVLDPFVREAILLELPNFPLCSEACPGIRPAPAAAPSSPEAERIDPRLAPLGALRARLAQADAKPARRPSVRPEASPARKTAARKSPKKKKAKE